jgi:hypothetical protein
MQSAVSRLDRVLAASQEDLEARQLEAAAPAPVVRGLAKDLDKLPGRWKLVYSSAFSVDSRRQPP